MSSSQINRTSRAQIDAGDWPALELNEADIERKCGTRMGFEPDIHHQEIYLPKSKIDEILVKVLREVPFDEDADWAVSIEGEILAALRRYEELCESETGPWVLRRGESPIYYHAEGVDGIHWTGSTSNAATFDQKGSAQALAADLERQASTLEFEPGSLQVVPISAALD